MSERPRERPRSRGPAVVLALTALFLLYLSVPNLGPALRAARPTDGTPGVFTAQRPYCVRHPGHESCTWLGEFRSRDGTVRRTGVSLHGAGRDALAPGRRAAAFDVGRAGRVYGPEGSREWMFTAGLSLAGVAILVALVLRRPRRTRPISGKHEQIGN